MNAITNTVVKTNPAVLVYLLAGVIFALGLLYMYLVGTTVMHVATRQDMQHDIDKLESEIANLENAYLEAQHLVSEQMVEVAAQQAEETAHKFYVKRQAPTLVLSGNSL